MAAWYNEIDPKTAAWLRTLIQAGVIADGEVDERSIVDVRPGDLRGFDQCHFFAGIGGWSLALRLAGWPDDRHAWTGSCPCQPFSAAGARAGGDDPRDLWPAWRKLIAECRPHVVFGEQVDAALAHGWLDRVCDDVEKEGYALGPVGLPAASVGAFHIRGRLWFVAESSGVGTGRDAGAVPGAESASRWWDGAAVPCRADGGVAESLYAQRGPVDGHRQDECDGANPRRAEAHGEPRACGEVCDVADTEDANGRGRERGAEAGTGTDGERRRGSASRGATSQRLADAQRGGAGRDARAVGGTQRPAAGGEPPPARAAVHAVHGGTPGGRAVAEHCRTGSCCYNPNECDGNDCWLFRQGRDWPEGTVADDDDAGSLFGPGDGEPAEGLDEPSGDDVDGCGPPGSFWSAVEWIPCRDGKRRPIEPGTFPLAHGVSNRVGRLRGYGNAIVPQVAAAFIAAYMDITDRKD